MESRLSSAALIGIAMLRNAVSRRRNDSAITPPISSGSRDTVSAVLSIAAAVAPPTYTRVPVPLVAAGTTSSRSVRTRSSVATDCGLVVGTTMSTAASLAGLSRGGLTAATPGTRSSRPRRSTSAAVSPGRSSSAASSSGPFPPGPKPWLSRS